MSDLEFLNALGQDETSLPRLPRVDEKKSGRLKPYENRLPRVPRLAPTEKHDARTENRYEPAPGEVGGQDIKSADNPDFQTGFALGFLHCWQVLFDVGMFAQLAPQSGNDCGKCQHLTMTVEGHPGTRRKFFWRCLMGYRLLEAGHLGERIIIAPPECSSYATFT